MGQPDLFAAAPEIFLALATMLILWRPVPRRGAPRTSPTRLSLAALVATAAICTSSLARDEVILRLRGLYVADPMANV